MRCAPGSMRVGKRCERFGAAASVGSSRHKDGRDLGPGSKTVQNPSPAWQRRRMRNRMQGDGQTAALEISCSQLFEPRSRESRVALSLFMIMNRLLLTVTRRAPTRCRVAAVCPRLPSLSSLVLPHRTHGNGHHRGLSASALPSQPSDEHPEFERGMSLMDSGKVGEAIDAFAAAAAHGSAGGNYFLALAYDNLLGENAAGEPWVEPDAQAAFRCYQRATEAGHAEAAMNLALCYRNGDGVEKHIGKTIEVLEVSAALGSDRAQYNLGVALDPLLPPWGTPGATSPDKAMVRKDPVRAAAFYRQAADQGHAKAKVNLGIFLYTATVPGSKPDKAGAEALWKEAHEDGVPEAEMCLRNMT